MTTARDFFDNLSETLMGRRGSGSGLDLANVIDPCYICGCSVTDEQLADGDAYVKDSAGNADGEYEHRECGQAMKGER